MINNQTSKLIINNLNLDIEIFDFKMVSIYKNSINFLDNKVIEKELNAILIDQKNKEIIMSFNKNVYKISLSIIQENSLLRILKIIEDITEIQTLKRKIKKITKIDKLTQLPNLYSLRQDINKLIRNNKKFSYISLDIQEFSKINNALGVKMGDKILKIIANNLMSLSSKSIHIYKHSSDKFVIIVYQLNDKIIKDIENKLNINGVYNDIDIVLTANAGISNYPEDGNDFDTLKLHSEIAMLHSKKNKSYDRVKTVYYSKEISLKNKEKLELLNRIRKALENHEFELYYQPQININTRKIIGLEALVRWNDPERGLIFPFEFIQLAEDRGFIIPLGYEIIEMAFKQISEWDKKKIDFGVLSINLSMKQLKEANFYQEFTKLIKKYNINTSKLALEITESYIMENVELSIKNLKKIRELGIKLAIDDFGTGYSSLSYLKKMPINKIKIDKSFIDNVIYDKNDQIIVKTIINLSEIFNLDIIAEGVETEEQECFLRDNNCQETQGYYFSKPITPKEMEEKYFNI